MQLGHASPVNRRVRASLNQKIIWTKPLQWSILWNVRLNSSNIIKSLLSQLLSPNRNAKFTTHLKLATLKSKFWERGWKISSTSWCFSMDESQWSSKFDLFRIYFPKSLMKAPILLSTELEKPSPSKRSKSLPLVDIPSGRSNPTENLESFLRHLWDYLSGAHPGGAFPNMASVPRFVGTAVWAEDDGSGMSSSRYGWITGQDIQ